MHPAFQPVTGGGEPDDLLAFPETGHRVGGGFRWFWETHGGLDVFGYPLSEELDEDGLTVQYFERARLEWHPGAWPEQRDVLLGRLGAETLEAGLIPRPA